MSPLMRPFKGKKPRILGRCFVAENAALIGDVEVQAEASIWYGVTLRADGNAIRIGKRANVQDGTVVHVDKPAHLMTTIGDGATIGAKAGVHARASAIFNKPMIKMANMLTMHTPTAAFRKTPLSTESADDRAGSAGIANARLRLSFVTGD